MRCINCSKLSIGNIEIIPFSDTTRGAVNIGNCGCERSYGHVTSDIKAAYTAARQARFGRGALAA
jgi:hypothetical protein